MESVLGFLESLANSGPTILVFFISTLGLVVAGLALYVVLVVITKQDQRGGGS